MLTEVVTTMLIMICIGLLAGAIGSILGIGGGLIVTPLLTWAMGLDIKYAIAASIVVVIATSSGSAIAYLKDNVINLRAAMFLEIFTTIGGLCGALITGILAPWILYILFSLLLVYSIINMLYKIKRERAGRCEIVPVDNIATKLKLNDQYYDEKLNKTVKYNVTRVPLGCGVMFGAGLLSGLLGIGSGIFKVIAMDNAMKMPLKPSNATSNLMMGVTAAASALVYFFNGNILPEIAVPVIIGVLAGAAIGTRIMPKLHPSVIRIMFVVVTTIFCIQMILKAVSFL